MEEERSRLEKGIWQRRDWRGDGNGKGRKPECRMRKEAV